MASAYKAAYKELRIVLVGKTGSGKSSAGNTILGPDNSDNHFKTEVSANSITKTCASQKVKIGDRIISVIDTPGQLDTSMSEQELKTEMGKCVYMSVPGPHVFLLVIKVGRFTEEEKSAVTWIKENFGEEAARYTIILFTHADQLKKKPFDEYISESKDLMAFVDECGGRVHSFNNEDMENRDQVTELLKKIEKMVEKNRGQHYNEMCREAQRKFEWEAWKQKAKDYGEKALTLVVGGTAVGAATVGTAALGAVTAAGGTGAALAGRAAATVGAAALAAVTAAGGTGAALAGRAAATVGAAALAAVTAAGGPGTGGPGAGGALAAGAARAAALGAVTAAGGTGAALALALAGRAATTVGAAALAAVTAAAVAAVRAAGGPGAGGPGAGGPGTGGPGAGGALAERAATTAGAAAL